MSQVSTANVIQLFKNVYGDLTDLQPQDFPLQRLIPFSQKQKIGEKYVEAVVLTAESGITLSASTDAFELNPAVAGQVRQTEVTSFISVLPSVLPWGVISRSAGAGPKAFYEATKYIIKNNLTSHAKFQEIFRIYGQAPALLGYVSYYTGFYRNVSFTNGTGTLNGISFVNGVSSAAKAILLAPGQFAAGIWVGMEDVHVDEVDASGTVVASGKLVSVNTTYGYIVVDYTPVAASGVTSNRVCFRGMANAQDYIGLNKILSTNGVLFGVPTNQYSLWKGNVYDCKGELFSLSKFQLGVAEAVNRGGLEGDLTVLVNPRSWSTLCTTEAGLRVYDTSYQRKAENGFESIEFFAQTGKATIMPHRMVKEGEAYALSLGTLSRSGSAEISFQIPGMGQDIIIPAQNQAAYLFRSYADQYLFCHKPAWNILFTNINDESAV